MLTIQDQGGGNDAGREISTEGQQGAHGRVVDGRVADLVVDDEVLGLVLLRVTDIDADEGDTAVFRCGVDLFERGRLRATGSAPLAPQIEYHDFARIILH